MKVREIMTTPMNPKRLLFAALAALLLGNGSIASAQDRADDKDRSGMKHEMDMSGDAKEGGMMGMCQQMMKGGAMQGSMMGGMGMMPALPPGNEKLQMQMHAEMMRTMAAVMEKYAARVKESTEARAAGDAR